MTLLGNQQLHVIPLTSLWQKLSQHAENKQTVPFPFQLDSWSMGIVESAAVVSSRVDKHIVLDHNGYHVQWASIYRGVLLALV